MIQTIESSSHSDETTICPRCHEANNSGSFFCYSCGKYFVSTEEDRSGSSNKRQKDIEHSPISKAKVILPGGSEIMLTGDPVFIERSDFGNFLPNDLLMCISRQHILITYGRGKYYVVDSGRNGKGSTNHTKLNGVDIYHKKKKTLKDGDKIELAGQPELTMTFELMEETK
jgi:hypothetical protein